MCAGNGNTESLLHDLPEQLGVFDRGHAISQSRFIFRIPVGHGRGANHQFSLSGKQLTQLIAGNNRAPLGEFKSLRIGLGFRTGDDGPGIEQDAGQPAHTATADADKMHPHSSKAARLASSFHSFLAGRCHYWHARLHSRGVRRRYFYLRHHTSRQ